MIILINFIICDDNDLIREIQETIISKVAMPYDFDYKVFSFSSYKKEMKDVIKNVSGIKIYILDIELQGASGIDIAKDIRKNDWESFIIISTQHDELELSVLKNKLLIFDFISKFDNYEKRLTDTINDIINNLNNKRILTFKTHNDINNVKFDDILYIYRDSNLEKVKLVTSNKEEFIIRESIKNIVSRLDDRFYKTHKACYVNKEKIRKIDFKNSIIYFDSGIKIDLLSRNYKKGLR